MLEIETTPAKIDIKHRRPEFKIRKEMPEMKIKREPPSFEIVSKEQVAGLMPILRLSKQFMNDALQKTMEAIAKIEQEGDLLAHGDEDTVAQIAKMRTDPKLPEVNIGLVPKEKPELKWDPGYLEIEWTDESLKLDWENYTGPEITVEPYSVEVRISSRPVVKITVVKDERKNKINKLI